MRDLGMGGLDCPLTWSGWGSHGAHTCSDSSRSTIPRAAVKCKSTQTQQPHYKGPSAAMGTSRALVPTGYPLLTCEGRGGSLCAFRVAPAQLYKEYGLTLSLKIV